MVHEHSFPEKEQSGSVTWALFAMQAMPMTKLPPHATSSHARGDIPKPHSQRFIMVLA
jgi:hypothetical protein